MPGLSPSPARVGEPCETGCLLKLGVLPPLPSLRRGRWFLGWLGRGGLDGRRGRGFLGGELPRADKVGAAGGLGDDLDPIGRLGQERLLGDQEQGVVEGIVVLRGVDKDRHGGPVGCGDTGVLELELALGAEEVQGDGVAHGRGSAGVEPQGIGNLGVEPLEGDIGLTVGRVDNHLLATAGAAQYCGALPRDPRPHAKAPRLEEGTAVVGRVHQGLNRLQRHAPAGDHLEAGQEAPCLL